MTSMLTLFILSQWTKVYSKVSINLLRMLQNQLASVLQSRELAARQAGLLLSAPPGSCPPGLPWALPLPLCLPVVLVFPSGCWDIKAGPAWRKRRHSATGQPSLAVSPGCCRDAAPSSRQGWLHWECVTCISICYSDSLSTLPDLLAPWIEHAFGAVPLLRCFLLHITL